MLRYLRIVADIWGVAVDWGVWICSCFITLGIPASLIVSHQGPFSPVQPCAAQMVLLSTTLTDSSRSVPSDCAEAFIADCRSSWWGGCSLSVGGGLRVWVG